jgi:hypothetical protein
LNDPLTMPIRRPNARRQKCLIDWLCLGAQDPQGDLRSGAIVGRAECLTSRIYHSNGIAGLSAPPIDYIARKDPEMP